MGAAGATGATSGAGVGVEVITGMGDGVGLGFENPVSTRFTDQAVDHTFETMRTKKSFSLKPHDSRVLSSVRILPEGEDIMSCVYC